MNSFAALVLLAPACVLWNDDPYTQAMSELTDADGDGVSPADGDCDDFDPEVSPADDEVCDGKDNDCNGRADEVPPDGVYCRDLDGDGYGDVATQTQSCYPETGWIRDCRDCNDGDGSVNPGSIESCNGRDDDCDGATDPDGAEGSVAWYPDEDGDGYGGGSPVATSCQAPEGAVADNSDCDDTSNSTYPGAEEICGDGMVNDCTMSTSDCGWVGPEVLSTTAAAFVAGPDTRNEALGFGVGFLDANADGIDDILMRSSGATYGDETSGALHVWYGAPSGSRVLDDTSTHVVGQPDLYLGSPLHSPSAVVVVDPNSGESRTLIPTQGFSDQLDSRGVILSVEGPLYGRIDASPDDIFARGDAELEGFGSTVGASATLTGEDYALIVGAPLNSERGDYSGAVYLTPLESPDAGMAQAVVQGENLEMIGTLVLCSDDLNGDGVDDLVLGTGYESEQRLYTVLGPVAGDVATPDADGYLSDTGWAPTTTITTPDLDGDGLKDLATQRSYSVVMHAGVGSTSASHLPTIIGALYEEAPGGVSMEFALATADGQGDGVPDLVVGVPYLNTPAEFGGRPEAGAVAVVPLDRPYVGSENIRDVATAVWYGPDSRAMVGMSIATGDVNADDYVDLLVGAVGWSGNGYPNAGGVWFILGGGS